MGHGMVLELENPRVTADIKHFLIVPLSRDHLWNHSPHSQGRH